MKQERIEQLAMSFQALGITVQNATEAMRICHGAIYEPLSEWEKLMIAWGHRKRCVLMAKALANQTNPFIKHIIWNKFKNL